MVMLLMLTAAPRKIRRRVVRWFANWLSATILPMSFIWRVRVNMSQVRFAPNVIGQPPVLRMKLGDNPVVLIGFSGGAQVAGLIASAKQGLNVKKIITIAGNLDHLVWTQYHNLPPLNESMNLESYRKQFAKIPQIHYVGSDDEIMPPALVREFVGKSGNIIEVRGATHNSGWEEIYSQIRNEK